MDPKKRGLKVKNKEPKKKRKGITKEDPNYVEKREKNTEAAKKSRSKQIEKEIEEKQQDILEIRRERLQILQECEEILGNYHQANEILYYKLLYYKLWTQGQIRELGQIQAKILLPKILKQNMILDFIHRRGIQVLSLLQKKEDQIFSDICKLHKKLKIPYKQLNQEQNENEQLLIKSIRVQVLSMKDRAEKLKHVVLEVLTRTSEGNESETGRFTEWTDKQEYQERSNPNQTKNLHHQQLHPQIQPQHSYLHQHHHEPQHDSQSKQQQSIQSHLEHDPQPQLYHQQDQPAKTFHFETINFDYLGNIHDEPILPLFTPIESQNELQPQLQLKHELELELQTQLQPLPESQPQLQPDQQQQLQPQPESQPQIEQVQQLNLQQQKLEQEMDKLQQQFQELQLYNQQCLQKNEELQLYNQQLLQKNEILQHQNQELVQNNEELQLQNQEHQNKNEELQLLLV